MIETLRHLGFLAIAFFALSIEFAFASDPKATVFFNPLSRERSQESKINSLRMVTVDDFTPFSSFTADGKLGGIHVDLAKAICAELIVEDSCTLQVVAFEDVANLLLSEQADVAFAGLIPNTESRKLLAFSLPYFRYPSKLLLQNGVALATIDTIGVISGSIHEQLADALFPNLKKTQFASEREAVLALNSGAVKALFDDGLKLAAMKIAEPKLNCCLLSDENYYLPAIRFDALNAAISLQRPELVAAINNALRRIAVDGRLDDIYLRHMPIGLQH